jgi:signal transduction histidine kinase
LLATTIVGLALLLGALALVVLQRQTLRDNLDNAIELRTADLAAQIRAGTLPAEIAVTDPGIALVQAADTNSNIVASTTNVTGQPLLFAVAPPTDGAVLFDFADLPIDDAAFRVMASRVEGPDGSVTLYVAASLEPVSESTGTLVAILRIGIPAMLAAIALGIWLVVGRALKPIESIRAKVKEISLSSLGERVPEPLTQDEVGRLARTMNELLARLEAGHAREEQFLADAAHELRSPLASLRTQLEVAAAEDIPGLQSLAPLIAEVTRLQALADNLLLLNAHDGGIPTASVLIDLDNLVLEEVRSVIARPGIVVDAHGVSAAAVRGDAGALRRVIRNLLDNAIRHAASVVTVTLEATERRVRMTVSDDGEGIGEADRDRVFERFVRLDASRSGGGAGLGLAICRAVIDRHGGMITLDSTVRTGARFIVELPEAE